MIRIVVATSLAVAVPVLACAQPLPLQPPLDHRPAIRPPAPGPCDDSLHRQFDFWVGRWDVTATGASKVVAHSLIERLYGGCAIRENWMPIGQVGGGSLSSYTGRAQGWRQTWVDSSGSWAEFKGGWSGETMVLTGPWPGPNGQPRLVRMTYTPGLDGSVRQAGEASMDDGRTWAPTFDYTYRRAARPSPLSK